MTTIPRYLGLRSKIGAVSSLAEGSSLEDQLHSLSERVYDDPAHQVLRDLDRLIGQLRQTETDNPDLSRALYALEDGAEQARSLLQ